MTDYGVPIWAEHAMSETDKQVYSSFMGMASQYYLHGNYKMCDHYNEQAQALARRCVDEYNERQARTELKRRIVNCDDPDERERLLDLLD